MSTGKPTVARRQLGLMLKRLREDAGKSQADAARAVGKDQTRLSRVEVGAGSFSTDELAALLDFLEVNQHDREAVLALGTEARRRRPRRSYTDNLPGSFQRLADLEADAVAICSYESGIIPGLLQSPDYMRAVIRACNGVWWEASEREVTARIEFRQEQQRRVMETDTPKRLSFVFTEDALHHEVGGPSVMRGQILHMLQLVESKPTLTLQVMPATIRDNPLLGGGILVLEFENAPRIGCASVVFGPCTYHDREADTGALLQAFRRSSELALSAEESRDLLVRHLKENWA
ncbi:helix-turn-helix domain-containing protein [Allosalinactinospora lopnorensis]|uniref:helix-turn-helix domain-containing protein n=1 Tax=Allosalinactinospora lopnorensis TaxID=1352348 RepID=UPI000623BB34|nr:helix-turn-helix transcriptional regulator [Allosalinactinospora lopnorensis]